MPTNPRFIIAEIKDQDFKPDYISPEDIQYSVRKAARGILVQNGKIALLFVTKENYHKLPGGGIEGNETNEEAFIREIREETGCECEIGKVGDSNSAVLEWRDGFKLFQISYTFFAQVVGEPKATHMTEEEISEDFMLKWVPFSEIDEVINNDNPFDYEGKFIQIRDRAIINHYRQMLNE